MTMVTYSLTHVCSANNFATVSSSYRCFSMPFLLPPQLPRYSHTKVITPKMLICASPLVFNMMITEIILLILIFPVIRTRVIQWFSGNILRCSALEPQYVRCTKNIPQRLLTMEYTGSFGQIL